MISGVLRLFALVFGVSAYSYPPTEYIMLLGRGFMMSGKQNQLIRIENYYIQLVCRNCSKRHLCYNELPPPTVSKVVSDIPALAGMNM